MKQPKPTIRQMESWTPQESMGGILRTLGNYVVALIC
jgi:hypothetical protein